MRVTHELLDEAEVIVEHNMDDEDMAPWSRDDFMALIRLCREALEVRDAMAAMYGKNLQWVDRLDRAAGEEESRG